MPYQPPLRCPGAVWALAEALACRQVWVLAYRQSGPAGPHPVSGSRPVSGCRLRAASPHRVARQKPRARMRSLPGSGSQAEPAGRQGPSNRPGPCLGNRSPGTSVSDSPAPGPSPKPLQGSPRRAACAEPVRGSEATHRRPDQNPQLAHRRRPVQHRALGRKPSAPV